MCGFMSDVEDLFVERVCDCEFGVLGFRVFSDVMLVTCVMLGGCDGVSVHLGLRFLVLVCYVGLCLLRLCLVDLFMHWFYRGCSVGRLHSLLDVEWCYGCLCWLLFVVLCWVLFCLLL